MAAGGTRLRIRTLGRRRHRAPFRYWFMSRLVIKSILAIPLFAAWFLLTASPLLLLLWWIGDREELRSKVVWFTAPLGMVCFFASGWLGNTTAHHLVDEKRMFLDSIKWSLCDLRLHLAFLPVIGWWLTPDEDLTHHDDEDD
jgi:hypothetical protein